MLTLKNGKQLSLFFVLLIFSQIPPDHSYKKMSNILENEYLSKNILTYCDLQTQLNCRTLSKNCCQSVDSWLWSSILRNWECQLSEEIKSYRLLLEDCNSKCKLIFEHQGDYCEKWIYLIRSLIKSCIIDDLKFAVKHQIDINSCQR